MFNLEGMEIDQNLLERTNPIFNTARMTLFQLATAGHEDAQAIAERLNPPRKIHRAAPRLRLMRMTFSLTASSWM